MSECAAGGSGVAREAAAGTVSEGCGCARAGPAPVPQWTREPAQPPYGSGASPHWPLRSRRFPPRDAPQPRTPFRTTERPLQPFATPRASVPRLRRARTPSPSPAHGAPWWGRGEENEARLPGNGVGLVRGAPSTDPGVERAYADPRHPSACASQDTAFGVSWGKVLLAEFHTLPPFCHRCRLSLLLRKSSFLNERANLF